MSKTQEVKELFERTKFPFPKEKQEAIAAKKRVHEQPKADSRKPSVRVQPLDEVPQPAAARSEPTQVEKNPAYVDITLPSNFYFYPFKSLAVRTFRANDQAKCVRAAKEGRFRHMVDAMSGTLQSDVSAYDLTLQDFYFVMYWHRMNSFNKSPYINRTICENEDHIAKVVAKELAEETLEISTILTKSTLKEIPLDVEKIYVPEELSKKYNLGILRIKDMVALEEMEDEPDFPDIEYLADMACYLAPNTKQEESIKERIKIVAEMTVDETDEMQAYIKSVNDYGVTETVAVKCKGCGAEKETKVSIDALSFLPTPR